MDESLDGRVFDYPRVRRVFRNWGWLIINIVPLCGLLSPFVFDRKNALSQLAEVPTWVYGLFFLFMLFGMWGYQGFLQKHQRILISSKGIYSRALRSEWRGIEWDAVEKIKRVMQYDQDHWRDVYEILIEGDGKTILFRDYILHAEELKSLLNSKAKNYDISVICVDKRDATLKAATQGLQPAEARQIRKTGVISELRAL